MTRITLLFLVLLSGTACAGPRGFVAFGAPPPPRVYAVRPPCPAPGFVWVDGYWAPGAASRWVWSPGAWVRPPRARAVWVAPRYHGRTYYRGYWR